MKRISALCMVFAMLFTLAVPAFAVELESSVTSGDTITDTYVFPVNNIWYESVVDSGTITGDEITLSLPEGDFAEVEVYYGGIDSLDALNMDGYLTNSVNVDVQFSIIGGAEYDVSLNVGDGSQVIRIDDTQGQVYESDELVTLSGSLDFSYTNRGVYPEIYLSIYSYSSNVWIKFESIKLTIVRNRVDRYEPDYTVPGDGVGEDLDDKQQDALDQVGDGSQAFEDVQVGVLDTLALYATSFLAVGVLLDTFLEIDFVDNLFVISLAVGSFALLLGLVLSFTRRND